MDAEQARTQIRAEVQNALVDSQNVMMTEMRTLITGEMKKLQSHNQKLAESQMAKVEEALDGSYEFKAILQVLVYKALYDKSYLGSKTTMTSGEWTCLISLATAPLTCSERGGSEKFKMKIYGSSGIRTHTPPVHDRKVAAP